MNDRGAGVHPLARPGEHRGRGRAGWPWAGRRV